MPYSQRVRKGIDACVRQGDVPCLPVMTIDTQWFVDRLAERRLSQRGMAKLMGLDSGALSLTLRGKRKMTLEEAAQIAVLLQRSTEEVLEAAGIPINTARQVPIIGVEQADGTVVLHPEGTHDMIEAPPSLPSDAVAIQLRTAGTDRSMYDGWLLYLSERQHTPDKAIDTMALVAMKSDGLKIRHVKRGYKRGTYNITDPFGRTQQNVELAWASPILWIKTVA